MKVAKEYTQEYEIDYEETFVQVVKLNMVWILITLTVNFNWKLFQYDVKNAFLHRDLEDEIYMELSPRYYEKKRIKFVD